MLKTEMICCRKKDVYVGSNNRTTGIKEVHWKGTETDEKQKINVHKKFEWMGN